MVKLYIKLNFNTPLIKLNETKLIKLNEHNDNDKGAGLIIWFNLVR